jgi:TonB family protein
VPNILLALVLQALTVTFAAPPRLVNERDVRVAAREGYAPVARELSVSGKVEIAVLVDPAGRMRRVEVRQSSGYKSLDMLALRVTRQMRFAALAARADTASTWIVIPYEFRRR